MTTYIPTKNKLYTFEIEEGSLISYHIDAFNKIILDLEDINVKIDDKGEAMILLCSLPNSYEHLVYPHVWETNSLYGGCKKTH